MDQNSLDADQQIPDPEPGRMKVRLNAHMLSKILDIPEGARIVGVRSDIDPMSVDIIVESPAFPMLFPQAEAPYVYGKVVTVQPGEHWRAEWRWDDTIAANMPPMCPLCGSFDRHTNNGCPLVLFHDQGMKTRSDS
jgi:hypothetical protein